MTCTFCLISDMVYVYCIGRVYLRRHADVYPVIGAVFRIVDSNVFVNAIGNHMMEAYSSTVLSQFCKLNVMCLPT